MKRLATTIARLLWLALYWREARRFRPPTSSEAPDWTQDDAAAVAHWWGTPTGQKLWRLVRVTEAQNNATAVLSKSGVRDYTCGMAAGFRAGMAWMLTLSQPLPAHEQGQPRATEDLADDSALRERMSP